MLHYIDTLKYLNDKISLRNLIHKCLSKKYKEKVIHKVLTEQESLSRFWWGADNIDVVSALVSKKGDHLQYASNRLKTNKEMILLALKSGANPFHLLFSIENNFIDDFDIAAAAIENNNDIYNYLSENLQSNKEIILLAIQSDDYTWIRTHIIKRFCDDKEIVLEIIKRDPRYFGYVSDRLKDDKEIMLTAVTQYGNVFELAGPEMKDDDEIALLAVQYNGRLIHYVSERLKNDEIMVRAALLNTNSAFRYIGSAYKKSYDVSLRMTSENWYNFEYVDDTLKQNHEFLLDVAYALGTDIHHIEDFSRFDSYVINFTMYNKNQIAITDWPIIKRALLIEPDLFLNPPSSIQAIFQNLENKFLLFAQYALNKESMRDIQPEMLPDDLGCDILI